MHTLNALAYGCMELTVVFICLTFFQIPSCHDDNRTHTCMKLHLHFYRGVSVCAETMATSHA